MYQKDKKDIKTYTKDEFIKLMARHCDMTQIDTHKALDALMKSVTEVLENGDKVSFVGFGSFEVSHRAARDGRNPATGEPLKIKASNSVRFGVGKKLKDAVN